MGRKSARSKFRDPDDAKLREDAAETAYRTLQEVIGERPKTVPPSERTEDQKNPEAVKRGRKGGKKGGKERALRMNAGRRRDIARKAAKARWHTRKDAE